MDEFEKISLPKELPEKFVNHPVLYMYNAGCEQRGKFLLYKVGSADNLRNRLHSLHHCFPFGVTLLWLVVFKDPSMSSRSLEYALHEFLEQQYRYTPKEVFARLNPPSRKEGRGEIYVASSCSLIQKQLNLFIKTIPAETRSKVIARSITIPCKEGILHSVDVKQWIENPENGVRAKKKAYALRKAPKQPAIDTVYLAPPNELNARCVVYVMTGGIRKAIYFGTPADFKARDTRSYSEWLSKYKYESAVKRKNHPAYWVARYLFGFMHSLVISTPAKKS